jgi:hypothetical protein
MEIQQNRWIMGNITATDTGKNWKYIAAIAVPMLCAATPAHPQAMTAEIIMTKMTPEDRYTYMAGIVEGLAYARYRNDNRNVSGDNKSAAGMACVYDWFYKNEANRERIIQAFRKFGSHYPGAIMSALIRKDCGE